MKVITFREDGEKVRLCDLEPGTLFEHNGCIALKSEYQTNRGLIEAAIVDSGKQFWGGAKTVQEQRELLVQPFTMEEDEETSTVDAVEVVRRNWIPVSERLPESPDLVVALTIGGDRIIARLDKYGWLRYGGYEAERLRPITHWMSLPEPPKEELHEA